MRPRLLLIQDGLRRNPVLVVNLTPDGKWGKAKVYYPGPDSTYRVQRLLNSGRSVQTCMIAGYLSVSTRF